MPKLKSTKTKSPTISKDEFVRDLGKFIYEVMWSQDHPAIDDRRERVAIYIDTFVKVTVNMINNIECPGCRELVKEAAQKSFRELLAKIDNEGGAHLH